MFLAVLSAACAATDEGTYCPVECVGLSEPECSEHRDEGQCGVVLGDRMGGAEELEYAGCRSACCEDGCDGVAESQTCAHAPGDPSDCWQFNSAVIPDGWIKLSEVELCTDIPQCNP